MSTPMLSSIRPMRRMISAVRGFSLIELMIAVTLGILLSLGLVTLFGATSKVNHVQEGMSQVQENGRYAVTQLNNDFRLASRQLMNSSGFSSSTPGAQGAVNLTQAPNVYVTNIPFPEGNVGAPAGWPAANPSWPLSPANFMLGNHCTAGACSPNTVPAYIPATSTTVTAKRVQNSDVLTVRYLNSEGWSSYRGEVAAPSCATSGSAFITTLTLAPVTTGTYPNVASNIVSNDLVLLTSSSGDMSIFKVTVAGTTLTPVIVAPFGNVPCPGSGEVKVFNFSRDFITVTYWLKLNADPEFTSPQRFIPSLIRTVADNTGTPGANPAKNDAELVQGVEQLLFRFGVQKGDGTVQYPTADAVATLSTAANCPPPPAQYGQNIPGTYEPGCMWRAVKSVETHLLVDSITNLFSLTTADMGYRFDGSAVLLPPAPTATTLPSGLAAGSMIRREFTALTSVRNYNP